MSAEDFERAAALHLANLQRWLTAEHERLAKEREAALQGTIVELRHENEELRQELATTGRGCPDLRNYTLELGVATPGHREASKGRIDAASTGYLQASVPTQHATNIAITETPCVRPSKGLDTASVCQKDPSTELGLCRKMEHCTSAFTDPSTDPHCLESSPDVVQRQRSQGAASTRDAGRGDTGAVVEGELTALAEASTAVHIVSAMAATVSDRTAASQGEPESAVPLSPPGTEIGARSRLESAAGCSLPALESFLARHTTTSNEQRPVPEVVAQCEQESVASAHAANSSKREPEPAAKVGSELCASSPEHCEVVTTRALSSRSADSIAPVACASHVATTQSAPKPLDLGRAARNASAPSRPGSPGTTDKKACSTSRRPVAMQVHQEAGHPAPEPAAPAVAAVAPEHLLLSSAASGCGPRSESPGGSGPGNTQAAVKPAAGDPGSQACLTNWQPVAMQVHQEAGRPAPEPVAPAMAMAAPPERLLPPSAALGCPHLDSPGGSGTGIAEAPVGVSVPPRPRAVAASGPVASGRNAPVPPPQLEQTGTPPPTGPAPAPKAINVVSELRRARLAMARTRSQTPRAGHAPLNGRA